MNNNASENKAHIFSETANQNNLCLKLVSLLSEKTNQPKNSTKPKNCDFLFLSIICVKC